MEPTTNNPTAADVERLTKSLEAARGDTKKAEAKASEFRKSIAARLGLAEDAAPDDVLARLGETDTERLISERLAPIVQERDEAKARAAEIESRWASEKIDAALVSAFEKSGARREHVEDYLLLARPLFTVDPKTGAVRTKADAPNTVPNCDPAAWIMGEYRVKRPHHFPLSVGGSAKGSRGNSEHPSVPGDTSAFKPGPTWNLTGQGNYVKRYGVEAASRAARLYGGGR